MPNRPAPKTRAKSEVHEVINAYFVMKAYAAALRISCGQANKSISPAIFESETHFPYADLLSLLTRVRMPVLAKAGKNGVELAISDAMQERFQQRLELRRLIEMKNLLSPPARCELEDALSAHCVLYPKLYTKAMLGSVKGVS